MSSSSSSLIVPYGPYMGSKLEVTPYRLGSLSEGDRNMAMAVVAASIVIFEQSIQLNEIDSRFVSYPKIEVTAYLSAKPTPIQLAKLKTDIDHPFAKNLGVRWEDSRRPESGQKRYLIVGAVVVSFESRSSRDDFGSLEIKNKKRSEDILRKKSKGPEKEKIRKKVIKNRSLFTKLIDFVVGIDESDIERVSESIE